MERSDRLIAAQPGQGDWILSSDDPHWIFAHGTVSIRFDAYTRLSHDRSSGRHLDRDDLLEALRLLEIDPDEPLTYGLWDGRNHIDGIQAPIDLTTGQYIATSAHVDFGGGKNYRLYTGSVSAVTAFRLKLDPSRTPTSDADHGRIEPCAQKAWTQRSIVWASRHP